MPSSELRVMAQEEVVGLQPQNFYLKFCFGFSRALLNGREPTKAEVAAMLKEEAAHYQDNPFVSAFLFCAADHVDIEPGIDNSGDGVVAMPYMPRYNECTSKCDINWM